MIFHVKSIQPNRTFNSQIKYQIMIANKATYTKIKSRKPSNLNKIQLYNKLKVND